ncbi:MAG: alpha/beta hydrolase [Abditibacteriota bacterium]|nr:alpha/beta hydrolase [Abditibacteriota bacterium]
MINVKKDIIFGKTTGGRPLSMYFYEPEGLGDCAPAFISIHGGGWIWGTAEDNVEFSTFIAEQGFKVFDIEYRLTGEARWPAQIEDCRTAVRHVRANHYNYGIDPGRIMAGGISAGGHLACMLGVLPEGKYEGGSWTEASSVIQGVLNAVGPADLRYYVDPEILRTTIHKDEFAEWIGSLVPDPRGDYPAMLTDISPVNYVRPGLCPHLNMYGGTDDIVMWQMGADYKKLLDAAGVSNTLLVAEGRWHEFSEEMRQAAAGYCRDFVEQKGFFAPRPLI